MSVEPLCEVRDHCSEVIDRVEHEHEETLAVLSDPDALADIREADRAYATGDVVRGIAAVRALRR